MRGVEIAEEDVRSGFRLGYAMSATALNGEGVDTARETSMVWSTRSMLDVCASEAVTTKYNLGATAIRLASAV